MSFLRNVAYLAAVVLMTCTGGEGVSSPQVESREQASKIRHPGFRADELFAAIREGDADEVGLLVDDGADINAQNDSGMTPVMVAVASNERNIVRLLIGAGCDLEAEYDGGGTALLLAAAPGTDERDQIRGSFLDSVALEGTSGLRPAGTLKMLLEAGANPNAANGSALFHAYSPEKVKLLLDYGANVDGQGNGGMTPLMAAALECWPQKVKLLLAHGANRHLRNQSGKTAAELVKDFQESARRQIAIAKAKRGAISYTELAGKSDLEKKLSCMEQSNLIVILR